MSRNLTPTVLAASTAEVVKYIVFVELLFDGGPVRVNSSDYDINWNTLDWTGIGILGEISAIQEKADLTAVKYDLALTGIPPEMISLALQENYKGRDATIWLALIDNSANLVILDAPVIIFQGWMDSMVAMVGSESKIVLTVESKLADWSKPRISRFTDAEQQLLYPNDKGFEFVTKMEDYEIVWGRG